MGGVVKVVEKGLSVPGQVAKQIGIGGSGKSSAAAPAAPMAEPRAAAMQVADEGSEERAARRRMRRGGRALLSEARLNPEQGVSTLGQTGL